MSERAQPPMTMPDDLLRTKLAPPRLDAACVRRTALLARIDAGLSRRLTLIAAPAGFGKTTLLAEWHMKLKIENEEWKNAPDKHNSQFSVAWLSLDTGDNDPVRFWRYL